MTTTVTLSNAGAAAGGPVTREDLDAAKADVRKCEDEIESIKVALRRFAGYGQDDFQPNQLDIVMLKWENLPEELTPTPSVTLQLSSPVEEIRLDQLWDPLVTSPPPPVETTSDEAAVTATFSSSSSLARFSGVETSMATLTVTAHQQSSSNETDNPLGSSEPIDVSLLCPLDAMDPQDVYQVEWPVTITKTDDSTTTPVSSTSTATEEKEEGASDATKTETTEGDKNEASDATTTTTTIFASSAALGTVTLRVTYKPSAKDQQEALYELLNKASQRKNVALEHLRQVSLQLSRSGSAESSTSSSTRKPTIQPGFLKRDSNKKPNRLVRWYQNTLGPQSFLRLALPVAKNYIIFFAAVVIFHYKGQELALPPPV